MASSTNTVVVRIVPVAFNHTETDIKYNKTMRLMFHWLIKKS
jgi:hypothetical protein